MIERDILIIDSKYLEIKPYINDLKEYYSSSFMTSLHKTADTKQKFPLLNLIRQLLNVHKYKLIPNRVANGYDENGIKKYKRFLL